MSRREPSDHKSTPLNRADAAAKRERWLEAVHHADKCLELLSSGKAAQAETHARRSIALSPRQPHFHNNLALTLIHLGRIKEALSVEQNLLDAIAPNNDFAKGMIAYIHYLLGNEETANQILNKTVKTRCDSSDALNRLCISLAIFRRDDDIIKLVRRNRKHLSPNVQFHLAVALANTGKTSEARQALPKIKNDRRPQDIRPIQVTTIARMRNKQPPGTFDKRWTALAMSDVVPTHLWQESLSAITNENETEIANGPLTDFALMLVNLDPDKALGIGDTLRTLDTPRGVQAMTTIASGRFGSDELRHECNAVLHEMGHRQAGQQYEIFTDGEFRSVTNVLIHEDAPKIMELPEEYLDLYTESLTASRAHQIIKALDLSHQLYLKLPTHPVAMGNYASHLITFGPSRFDEAERLLHDICERYPSYAHSHANLAIHYCYQGRIKKAEAILQQFVQPTEIHPESMAWLYVAQCYLAHAQGDIDSARRKLEFAEEIEPDHPRLAEVRERLFPDGDPC